MRVEVRDPIHGSIHIIDAERLVIEHPFFQRLRGIKQLGFSEYAFPGATHTRYLHSLGVMRIGSKTFDSLFKEKVLKRDYLRLKETLKLACLLHDIGHAPLSHTTEMKMPLVKDLKLPPIFVDNQDRQATHEDYTIKSIIDSSFTESFAKVEKLFGVQKEQIAELVIGKTQSPEYFTLEGLNYFPLLHQLVSSELDCDRMDYLLRDSYFCGVSYGKFDLDWIIDNLEICPHDNSAYLGISERAVATFDDFLLSRYHMFLMVYFHYRPVCMEKLLHRYFETCGDEYSIPANIEEYQDHDDYFLIKVLRHSQNEYAKAIVSGSIPPKVYESFNAQQLSRLEKIEKFLESQKIDFIRCSSASRLSKYYNDTHPNKFSMKVVRKFHGTHKKYYTDISEATDLFTKFSQSHEVNRLHCDFSPLATGVVEKIQALISQ